MSLDGFAGKVETEPIRCATCGEESGGKGTSLYGHCHKYGPTTHHFTPARPIVAECWTCPRKVNGILLFDTPMPLRADLPPWEQSATADAHRRAGHDVRPVSYD